MALSEMDAQVLAAALVTDGLKADQVYTVQWGEPPAHRGGLLVPVDFTHPAVMLADDGVAEAWRRAKPEEQRSYHTHSMEHGSPASGVVLADEGRERCAVWMQSARDKPTSTAEAVARALLAWAQAQRGASF